MVRRWSIVQAALASLLAIGAAPAPEGVARPTAPFVQIPKGPASFFVTSRGLDGGNLGGVAGADAHCEALATAAGIGNRGWRAYLSTQAVPGRRAVHARDRISKGPWYNVERVRVAEHQAELHGDTIDRARAGNVISKATALTEQGKRIPGKADPILEHDILTGSRSDGRAFDTQHDRTCRNWTWAGADGSAQIGHSDRDSLGLSISWNSAHQTVGCSREKLAATGGAGLFYCFATDLSGVR